jgi:hypothetical protein
MMSGLLPRKDVDPERMPGEGPPIEIGQWYWLKREDQDDRFSCVTKIGSNFVELTSPYGNVARVHLDHFDKECRLEKDPEAVILGNTDRYKMLVRDKIREISVITARLGVQSDPKIEDSRTLEATRSLSVISGIDDVKDYKKKLILAKDKDLPKLFEEVKEANENLTVWMKAQVLPLAGMIGGMKDCVGKIEDKIFSISLYAGLTEEVEEVAKGKPADILEKLRIMQRLAFMDEECLLNYRHGGMEFDDIGEFDRWLALPENLDRILPFPRCMVAFRVRRGAKDRGPARDLGTALIHFNLEKMDELTFLYIKNGERLYRLNCDLEFGELIFPGRDELRLDEPMMARVHFSDVEEIITKRHYDDLVQEWKKKAVEEKQKALEWAKKNPKEKAFFNPHAHWSDYRGERLGRDYEPFNKDSVYYDEMKGEIERRVKQYNRIALIVQGLYDRSEVLHPHPPVRLWSPGGFEAAVDLVYADHGLYHGEAPDFEAYRLALNASLGKGSVTVGQEEFWERREAKRESGRWNRRGPYDGERYRPSGNPGPGYIAEIAAWSSRSKKATFRWIRERRTSNYHDGKKYGDPMNASILVPDTHLFNVNAYKPGDYKKFFADPRTRAQYFKWAPLLLAAEEFHAGNLKVGTYGLEAP